MKGQFFTILLVGIILFGLDVYLAGGLATAFKKRSRPLKKGFKRGYIIFSAVLILAIMACIYLLWLSQYFTDCAL